MISRLRHLPSLMRPSVTVAAVPDRAESVLVSVVIATYNRSGVLRHAVQSALDSSIRNLEVIVVGDHCTDDTAEVIGAIADPRVRFVNLPAHGGDQSGPNNHGIQLARGRFVAMLNHDDLFFPDHLDRGIARLEETGADLVWSAALVATPLGDEALGRREWSVLLASTPPGGVYDPLIFCVASSWIFRRELAAVVGPWRPGPELFVFPSQDWIFRAWRSGARLLFEPQPGALLLHSGSRARSYAAAGSPEHECYARELRCNPRFRQELLESLSTRPGPSRPNWRSAPVRRLLRLLAAPLRALCVRAGIHPLALALIVFGPRRRGAVTKIHRGRIGLAPLLPRASAASGRP